MAFQYLKGACKKERKRVLKWADGDRTRDCGFKLEKGRFRLDERRKLFSQKVVRQKQVNKRSCWCPIPGSVQGQFGWDPELSDLVNGIPANGRWFGAQLSLMPFPSQTIP